MYGLLLENLATFVKQKWGEGKWESICRHAGIGTIGFSIHYVYTETLLRRLSRSALLVLGVDERQFFESMGLHFVQYVSQYGYDQLLSVLGRNMRDFLNGLDNLHEYLKFSYPKMRAPSFYCDDETESGLKLHYRTKRRGFVYYVMGQIKQVASQFYHQKCEIFLLKEEVVGETMHVVFQLIFDNRAFTEAEAIKNMIGKDIRLPFSATTLFELFPFCIVFNSEMEITHTGHTLMTILKDLVGQIMTEAFDMTRPMIPFCFSAIMQRQNNIFELVTVAPLHDVNQVLGTQQFAEDADGMSLRLRGQMMFMEDWNMMLYLSNPVMPELNSLVDAGLFINDLSLHDCSRDLVLAGTQQSVELKLALDQEQDKSNKLVQNMQKLDEEMSRYDELFFQNLPKEIADGIRSGSSPRDATKFVECVSILYCDVVNFTEICEFGSPAQAVRILNHIHSLFDQLAERHSIFKLETIGGSFLAVAGAPKANSKHAEQICEMAMDMVDAVQAIEDPFNGSLATTTISFKIRVGIHSSSAVTGVVGNKPPRFCVAGDCLLIASNMESSSEPSGILISEACKNLLPSSYNVELRGMIGIKRDLNTFWLKGRESRETLSKRCGKGMNWNEPIPRFLDGIMRPTSSSSVGNIQAPPERIYHRSRGPSGSVRSDSSTKTLMTTPNHSRENLFRSSIFHMGLAGAGMSSSAYKPRDRNLFTGLKPVSSKMNFGSSFNKFGNQGLYKDKYQKALLPVKPQRSVGATDSVGMKAEEKGFEDVGIKSGATPDDADEKGPTGIPPGGPTGRRRRRRRRSMPFLSDCCQQLSAIDNSDEEANAAGGEASGTEGMAGMCPLLLDPAVAAALLKPDEQGRLPKCKMA